MEEKNVKRNTKDKGRVDLYLGKELKEKVDEKAASLGLNTNAYLRMLVIQTIGGVDDGK